MIDITPKNQQIMAGTGDNPAYHPSSPTHTAFGRDIHDHEGNS